MQFMLARQRGFHSVQIELSILSSSWNQLGATRKKFAGAAFVILDVRVLMTEHAVKWLAELGQGERVRSRAVEGQINIAIRLEQLPHPVADSFCPLIIAVGGDRLISVCFLECGPGFWTQCGCIIASELVARFYPHCRSRSRVSCGEQRTIAAAMIFDFGKSRLLAVAPIPKSSHS